MSRQRGETFPLLSLRERPERPLPIRDRLDGGGELVAAWRGGGRRRQEVGAGGGAIKDELHGGASQNASAVVIPAALRLRTRHLPPLDALWGGGGN